MKEEANISLRSLSELRQSGPVLALRKGVNELRLRRVRPGVQPMPPASRPPALSLIICTAGVCPGLETAIRSGLSQTAPCELVVVWNRADPPPRAQFPPDILWVHEPDPGLSRARNSGAARAAGEFLLYMDDDAAADPGLAAAILRTFRARPRAAVVGGQIRLVLPDPRPEAVLPGREGLWSAYTVPFKSYRPIREQYEFPYGACFGVRASVLDALGGFPLEYGRVGEGFAGGEETALCFLARQRGWEVGIQPAAWVEHRVEPRRFTRRHVREALRAGIFTTYRLCQEGYAPWQWDLRYIRERISIASRELERLNRRGSELERFYKKCELDAFGELYLAVRSGQEGRERGHAETADRKG